MKNFKSKTIIYKGREQRLTDVVHDAWLDAEAKDFNAAYPAILALQDKAIVDKDEFLFEEARLLMEAISRPSPYPMPSFAESPASQANMPVLPEGVERPPQKTKRPPIVMKVAEGAKTKMAQLIHLGYKDHWFVANDGNNRLALSDVNGSILNFNFESLSGALSNLYAYGNWEGLWRDIQALSTTERHERLLK